MILLSVPMAARTIASRPKRQQHVEPDDVLLARTLEFAEWARRNIVLVATTAIVLIVVIAGLFWWRTSLERQREEAAIAFLQVEQGVLSGNESVATQQLQQFIQTHSDTPYGDEARVLLGQLHLQNGRSAEAIAVLEPVAERGPDSVVGTQAGLLLASAQAAAGQRDQAIATYLEVADEAEVAFRQQEGLMGAALLMQEAGDYASAAELFRQLVDLAEEGSPDKLLFEMRLAEAEALAAAQ